MMFDLTPFVHKNRYVADPFKELRDMERLFTHPNMDSFRVDIKETKDAYQILAELPGFTKEDIKLSVDGDYLTISVSRQEENDKENEESGEKYLHRERFYGTISRSFSIGDVSVDAISAAYENGILTLTLPKKTVADTTKTIQIQ